MVAWETFSGLSGNGDLTLTLSGIVQVVRVDVTSLGVSNIVDPDASFERRFKIGWWTFTDNAHSLDQAATSPVNFIDFEHCRFDVDAAIATQIGGYGFVHYHFYGGVVADINVEEQ